MYKNMLLSGMPTSSRAWIHTPERLPAAGHGYTLWNVYHAQRLDNCVTDRTPSGETSMLQQLN